jgi:uncharacterized membrane protein YgcG
MEEKSYPAEVISTLTAAINGDNQAYDYLVNNHLKELAALRDYLHYGDDEAMNFLQRFGFKTIASFAMAFQGDEEALRHLLSLPEKEWAATIFAANDDSKAKDWLYSQHLSYFVLLANALNTYKNSSFSSGLGGIGTIGGISGGSGFGGFGGGSFGGGGGGSSW